MINLYSQPNGLLKHIRWWYTYPSEKYEFVSWDDDIPNWMESHKTPWFQTTKQLINHH